MGVQDRLREDLKVALRERNSERLSIIRVLLAECKNAEIARMHALDDAEVIEVLSREAKRRVESIDAFRSGGRSDLVTCEEEALAVIKEYLPAQMSRDEVVRLARESITVVGATGPKDKGKVMSHLMPSVKGKADGKEVNEIVTEMLSTL